jgi:hypothetical protein
LYVALGAIRVRLVGVVGSFPLPMPTKMLYPQVHAGVLVLRHALATAGQEKL